MYDAYHLTDEGNLRMSLSFDDDDRQLFVQPTTTGVRVVPPWLPDLGWNLALAKADDVHVVHLTVPDFVSKGLDILDCDPRLVMEVGDKTVIEFRLDWFQSTVIPAADTIDDWHEQLLLFLLTDKVARDTWKAMNGDPKATWSVVHELERLESMVADGR